MAKTEENLEKSRERENECALRNHNKDSAHFSGETTESEGSQKHIEVLKGKKPCQQRNSHTTKIYLKNEGNEELSQSKN